MTARWRARSSDMVPSLPGRKDRCEPTLCKVLVVWPYAVFMLPTVADLLSLDVLRRGSPQVVAGSGGLGARVRWVHVLELADAAHLLQGGELVLTTGVALPAEPALLARYAADLASAGGAGVSALAVELGRRYVGALPGVLVRAAADSGLTLIAFEREVSFVEITEAVHARIIDAQLDELRASERLHEVFTELSVSGASADEVVRQAAILAGRPVILADLSHRVLAFEPGSADPARLLAGFARRSRALASSAGRTSYDEASGWLFTLDGARAGAMLSLSPHADPDRVLHGLTARITERARGSGSRAGELVIGVGAVAGSIRDVRRSFLEASQVADVAAERPGGRFPGSQERPSFYRLADLRLRGLLHLLRDDPRVQTFVERELGPLLSAEPDTSQLDVLAAYLAAGGNKAEAAKRAHLARPTFFERLRRIERILGTDLGSAESRTSLHVALLALEAARHDLSQGG